MPKAAKEQMMGCLTMHVRRDNFERARLTNLCLVEDRISNCRCSHLLIILVLQYTPHQLDL